VTSLDRGELVRVIGRCSGPSTGPGKMRYPAEARALLMAASTRFCEHEPVNFFGHSLSRVDIRAMSAKRSHSLIELCIRQPRQEGVGAQGRLPNEASPVRRYDFRDDLMVPRREASGRKVRPYLIAGWQVGVEHGPHRRKKVWHDDIVFARSGADANITADAQDTPAFSRYRSRIGQVVIDLRHKHEIDAAIRERKLAC
jgi:hypothetical protein